MIQEVSDITEGHVKQLTSIVAIDRNGAIGCRNTLPWKLKSDLSFFKATTLGNAVIMGRKTYDSIGKSLPGRLNVVLSHNNALFPSTPECKLVASVDEALYLSEHAKGKEAFIIGGAQTYSEFAPYVDRYLVTVVDCEAKGADAFLAGGILQDFARWDRQEMGVFPAKEGHDDFAFSVFEIVPDNVPERQAWRTDKIQAYGLQVKRAPKKARPAEAVFGGFQQPSFI
jgi:dihydrofolate reductase